MGLRRARPRSGVPDGIYTTLHGFGDEAGAPARRASGRRRRQLYRIVRRRPLDCGNGGTAAGEGLSRARGKNPLIVCDDADQKNAVTWTIGSAFSNAGQRCASGSRIVVFDAVYDNFKQMLLDAVKQLKVGRRRRRLRAGDQ